MIAPEVRSCPRKRGRGTPTDSDTPRNRNMSPSLAWGRAPPFAPSGRRLRPHDSRRSDSLSASREAGLHGTAEESSDVEDQG